MRVRLPIPTNGYDAADLPEGDGAVEEHLVDDGVLETVEEGVCCGDGIGFVGDQRGFIRHCGTARGAGRPDDHLLCGDDQAGVQVRVDSTRTTRLEEVCEGGGGR